MTSTLIAVSITMAVVVLIIFLMLAPVAAELAPAEKHLTRTTVCRIRRLCALLATFLGSTTIIVLLTILVAHALMARP